MGLDKGFCCMEKVTGREVTVAGLKIIAYTSMFIDHFASIIVKPYLEMRGYEASDNMLLEIMSGIGRLAFPIFCFMLIEGIKKSSNRKKYLFRLLIMAIISEPCFDLAHGGNFFDPTSQNVCITLFIGGCMLALKELYWERIRNIQLRWGMFIATAILAAAITRILKTDYNITGIAIIIIIYYIVPLMKLDIFYAIIVMGAGIYMAYFAKYFIIYPKHRMNGIDWQWYLEAAWTQQMLEPIVLFFINKYTGKKGRTMPRLVYYGFYPLHLLILGLIAKVAWGI